MDVGLVTLQLYWQITLVLLVENNFVVLSPEIVEVCNLEPWIIRVAQIIISSIYFMKMSFVSPLD